MKRVNKSIKILSVIVTIAVVLSLFGHRLAFADEISDDADDPMTDYLNPAASVSTQIVIQPDNDTCGPASAYMALKGCGVASYISGNTTEDKIHTLAIQMSTTSDGTSVPNLRNGMNYYLSTKLYSSTLCTNMSLYTFKNKIYYSLSNGRIVILHAKTNYLGYYNGHSFWHYIAVQACDEGQFNLTLYDSNKNLSYYGIHTVPASEAYNSIHAVAGRYIITY